MLDSQADTCRIIFINVAKKLRLNNILLHTKFNCVFYGMKLIWGACEKLKVRRGYVSSVKIFRRLKVSSSRKKFVTFHRRKHLTNFEISNFSKNISEKRYRYFFSRTFIFLFSYNNVHVNVKIYRRLQNCTPCW